MAVLLEGLLDKKARKNLEETQQIVSDISNPEEIEGIILSFYPVTAEVMDKCSNLKVIAKHGVGCDTIDLEAAKERGIPVVNAPRANTNAVAELIVGMILDLSRKISEGFNKTKGGIYNEIAPNELVGSEITGKTIGLIGLGNIGKRLGIILKNGFNMNVLFFDPHISDEVAQTLEFKRINSIPELIEQSDIVNISVPLTEETRDLISGDVFDHFKEGAILINAARGGLVNEDDLYLALKNNKLAGYACDSMVIEPPTQKTTQLFELDNFLATPHIGANTTEALEEVGKEVVEEVLDALNGKEPVNRVV